MTRTLGLLLTACLAACGGPHDVRYSAGGSRPELVTMDSDPSVMVVANADEPVFFSENTYWLYRDRSWYRSSHHRDGWTRVDTPPSEHIRRIERPEAYVHFRGATQTTQNEPGRAVERAPTPVREDANAPMPAEQVAPRRDERPDAAPAREPNPQGPSQPYGNPLPPHQVPPVPDASDRRELPIPPDASRPPVTPGQRNRAADQRPATAGDVSRGPAVDQPPPPKQ